MFGFGVIVEGTLRRFEEIEHMSIFREEGREEERTAGAHFSGVKRRRRE